MKSAFLATSLFMVSMGSLSTMMLCPSAFAQAETLVSKTIPLRYIPASEAARIVKSSKATTQPDGILPVGVIELTSNDNENTLLIRGTPTAIAKLEAAIQLLDVKPRMVKVAMHVIEITRSADGTIKESLLQSPILTTTNNRQADISFRSNGFGTAEETTKVAVTPCIESDNFIVLNIAFALARPGGKTVQMNTTTRVKQKEWKAIRTISLVNDAKIQETVLSGTSPDPAAYPLYRLEASATDVSDDKSVSSK